VTVSAFNSRARIPLSATVIFNVMVFNVMIAKHADLIGEYLVKRAYTKIEQVETRD
jgi:hypothetical protein